MHDVSTVVETVVGVETLVVGAVVTDASVDAVTGQPTSTSKPDLVSTSSEVKVIVTDVPVDGYHWFKLIPLGSDEPESPNLENEK